jgi:hypothetical protein
MNAQSDLEITKIKYVFLEKYVGESLLQNGKYDRT